MERPPAQRNWHFDGVSIMPILRGQTPVPRGIGWMYNSPHRSARNGYAFRYGKWKYVVGGISCDPKKATFDCHRPQLYDMDHDYAEVLALLQPPPPPPVLPVMPAMKAVRQARLELSGGSTPDQLKPCCLLLPMQTVSRASNQSVGWVCEPWGRVGGAGRDARVDCFLKPLLPSSMWNPHRVVKLTDCLPPRPTVCPPNRLFAQQIDCAEHRTADSQAQCLAILCTTHSCVALGDPAHRWQCIVISHSSTRPRNFHDRNLAGTLFQNRENMGK